MSQQNSTINSSKKRTRTPRNRPVLVTGAETTESNTTIEDLETTTSTLVVEEEQPIIEETPEPVATPRRGPKLPKFFSKVEKDEQESETDEKTVVEARMARAQKSKNNKAALTATDKDEAAGKTTAKPATTKAGTTAKPQKGLFKMQHIIGMMIYLLAAQLLLPLERTFLTNNHLDPVFVSAFSLFGLKITIDMVFVVTIATLIILLYLLVHFNLLPNSKDMAVQQASKSTTTKKQSVDAPSGKAAPLVMRQGVRGEDDDLYQAYRTNQRRDKKR